MIDAYSTNDPFKQDIHLQLFTNIKGKIEEWEQNISDEEYHIGIDTLSRLLLEEIAVTIYLREEEGYKVEVYPSSPMQLVEKIYSNNYPILTRNLNLNAGNYGYIYLDVDEA